MKRFIAVAVVGLLLPMASVSAATTEINVIDRQFQPAVATVEVGDVVHWTTAGTQEPHNARQNQKLFYSGRPTAFIDFKAVFSAGTFAYFCERHGNPGRGMDGIIKVPAKLLAGPSGAAFTVQWATAATDTGAKFDVQYRIGGGAWREWLTGTAALKKVFGARSGPTDVEPGTKYGFRVRSRKGATAKSDWSPAAVFQA